MLETTAFFSQVPGPHRSEVPRSVAELGDIVRGAAAAGQAVYPLGGGTMLDLGLPPARAGIIVQTTALDQVIDYPARDMTVTVQAGIRMARLQEVLRGEKQRLPIDVPLADRATLGGALAVNASGPRRYGFGTFRDYVIGISAVNDQGQEIKAGGRVVKNVAGYDLCKLFIGSLGTLGIITQVTLKLRPVPPEHALVSFGCEADAIEPLLDTLHRSATRPVCLELLNAAAVEAVHQHVGKLLPQSPWVLAVGYEESQEAVGWQVQQLVRELPPGQILGLDARLGLPAELLWHGLVELAARLPAPLVFQANLLPRATADFCRLADRSAPLRIQAHAGNGIVLGFFAPDVSEEQARAAVVSLRSAAVAAAGNLVLLRCPAEWKARLGVWGEPRGDAGLMQAVKAQLDPQSLFNPGRFLAGI